MKFIGFVFLLSMSISTITFAQNLTKEEKMNETSYSIGMVMADALVKQGMEDLNVESFVKGFEDMIKDHDTQFSLDVAMQNYQAFMQEKMKHTHETNKTTGERYLQENAKRKGVIILPSGLQYEVIQEGDGASPTASDKVKTHYHGTLIDGTVFDSSVERGEPISFPVNGVIKAWQEILPMMKVGSKYKIYAPYNLAYGERGAGQDIKPYSALIFEIELLGINE